MQIVLQPLQRGEVEVVRRLVQQEQIRLLQQQLAERGACLLAAAQMRSRARLLLARKAEAIQHLAHARLQRIAARVLEALLYIGVARERRVVGVVIGQQVGIGQARGEGRATRLPSRGRRRRRQHLLEEGVMWRELGDLRQIAHRDALGEARRCRRPAAAVRRADAAASSCPRRWGRRGRCGRALQCEKRRR